MTIGDGFSSALNPGSRLVFFDRDKVLRAVDDATRRRLSRFGAFVRTRAQRSMRRRRGVSKPGSPPYSHSGELRKLLYFGFDAEARSVVIGPVPFKEGEVPELLEFGGDVPRQRWNWDTRRRDGDEYLAHYEPRPFMRPAFEAELGKVPDLFKNAVGGAAAY